MRKCLLISSTILNLISTKSISKRRSETLKAVKQCKRVINQLRFRNSRGNKKQLTIWKKTGNQKVLDKITRWQKLYEITRTAYILRGRVSMIKWIELRLFTLREAESLWSQNDFWQETYFPMGLLIWCIQRLNSPLACKAAILAWCFPKTLVFPKQVFSMRRRNQ